MKKTGVLLKKMCEYYSGDILRINHFMKVYGFAKAIGESEKLDEKTMYILETAAVVHDIGIKASEEKYGVSDGKYQEIEGPPIAEKMLAGLGYDKETTDRVCWLIAHHHTYSNIEALDYQILIEADFLVNIYEDNIEQSAAASVKDKIFRTHSGKMILENLFGV